MRMFPAFRKFTGGGNTWWTSHGRRWRLVEQAAGLQGSLRRPKSGRELSPEQGARPWASGGACDNRGM